MPNEILVRIMGYIKVTDSASFALTCKHIARIATLHQALRVTLETAPGAIEKAHFFHKLAKDWVPRHLLRCINCGLFVSTKDDFWRIQVEKMRVKLGGSVACHWNEHPDVSSKLVASWCKNISTVCPICTMKDRAY